MPIANVTTSSSEILPARDGRAGFVISNPPGSGATVWINVEGGAATTTAGSTPIAEGDSFAWRGTGAVNAIAGSNVSVNVVEH
jgi:hypothetical protein